MANKQVKGKAENNMEYTQWGDPVLSNVTKPLPMVYIRSTEFKKIIARMFSLIEGKGVGLAANQIGMPLRFAIVMIEPNPLRPNLVPLPRTVLVNPKILRYSKEKQAGWEGCMSCPGSIRFYVPRARWVDVEYIDGWTYKKIEKRVEGFQAIVFQHEIDHLYGMVCGEQVMTKNGKVLPGAIISVDWYLKTKASPPKAMKSK